MRRDLSLGDEDGSAHDQEEFVTGSEDAMASEFASLYRHLFQFTPGLGWMRCGTDHWARDEHLTAYDCARQVAHNHALDIMTATANGEPNAKSTATARGIASSKSVNGLLALAKSDPVFVLSAKEWDVDPFEFNTPGGIVDLRTGDIHRRGETSYFTQLARVAPNFEGECPVWLRFLDEVFQGDEDLVEFMQRLIGYTLTGDRREQKIFFMHGQGANGKSTLWDFVAWLAGTYFLKLPAHVLMHTQYTGHPTELAQLLGKRLAISSEIEEGNYWAEARIKELSGDQTLSARFMRQDFFEFSQTQKHVIVGNYKPRMKGHDTALARRFVLVPFLAKFTGANRDNRMLEKLRAEAGAVLAWAIRGAVKWHSDGLAVPASVSDASRDYMAENDDLQAWLDECCVVIADARCKATPLYNSYLGWTKARGQHAPSMRLWADRMSALPGVAKRKNSDGVMVYQGVGLKAAEETR